MIARYFWPFVLVVTACASQTSSRASATNRQQNATQPLEPTIKTLLSVDSWVSGYVDSPDGRTALYRASGQYFMHDRQSGTTAPITLKNATDISWSPKRDRVVFVRRAADGAPAIWTAPVEVGGEPVDVARRITGRSGAIPSFSPDGNTIAFVSGGNAIFTAPADSGAERLVYQGSVALSRPQWSRDGAWIYFVRAAVPPNGPVAPSFMRVRSAGGDAEVLHSDADGTFLGLSRDGQLAAWYLDHYSLVVLRTLRGETAGLMLLPPRVVPSGWSQAGRKLLAIEQVYPSAVFVIDVATGTHRQLSGDWSEAMNARYSPDGAKIVYQNTARGRRHLVVADANGTNKRGLDISHEPLGPARWSPDGSSIAFIGRRRAAPTNSAIVVVDVRSGVERVLSPISFEKAPVTGNRPRLDVAWRADSRALVRLHQVAPDSLEFGAFDLDGAYTPLWGFRPLTRPRQEFLHLLAGDWVAFSNRAEIEVVNLRERSRRVVHQETRNIGVGYDGVIGFSSDSETIALYGNEQTASGRTPVTKLVPLRGGAPQYVVTGMERTDVLQLAWLPDGQHVVVRGALAENSENRSLRVVPLRGGGWRDIGAGIGAIDFRNDMNVSRDGRTVLITAESYWGGKLVEIDVLLIPHGRE